MTADEWSIWPANIQECDTFRLIEFTLHLSWSRINQLFFSITVLMYSNLCNTQLDFIYFYLFLLTRRQNQFICTEPKRWFEQKYLPQLSHHAGKNYFIYTSFKILFKY